MKLELLDIMAHRVADENGDVYLRLSMEQSFGWYRPAPIGFDVIPEGPLDSQLEAAFQVNLTRKVASWAN